MTDDTAAHSQDNMTSSRRFCWQFVVCFVIAIALVASLNFIVNPMAEYPTQFFRPAVQTPRIEKLNLLRSADPIPDGLVLGSSRVMKLEPDYLSRQTQLCFFNAGVNYALPEDHLAIYRWYKQQFGRAPRMVVLGIDVYSFSEQIKADPRLINHPELVSMIPEAVTLSDRCKRWEDLLSWQQTRESVRSLLIQLRQRKFPEPDDVYRDDGLLVYRKREREIAAGTYDFEGPLAFNCREYEALYRGFDELSSKRCELFSTLARECEQDATRLIVYLTPLHPRLRSHLASRTTYETRHAELLDFIARRSLADHFVLFDATDIESFAGDAEQFVDGIHALEANTRRLVDALLNIVEGRNAYAVQ
jgi:hypothetical protein